jgi:hypothetical protein
VDASIGLGYRRTVNEGHVDGFTRAAWLGRVALDLRY